MLDRSHKFDAFLCIFYLHGVSMSLSITTPRIVSFEIIFKSTLLRVKDNSSVVRVARF